MKRLNITSISIMILIPVLFLAVITLILTAGCTTGQIQVDQDSQITIAKIAGRRAGYELESQYPKISYEVLTLSKDILSSKEPDLVRIAINSVVVILASEIDDPLLAADLQDVIALIKVETGIEISDEHMQIIQATASGLVSGIEIARREL